jgi:hypothetical protein
MGQAIVICTEGGVIQSVGVVEADAPSRVYEVDMDTGSCLAYPPLDMQNFTEWTNEEGSASSYLAKYCPSFAPYAKVLGLGVDSED